MCMCSGTYRDGRPISYQNPIGFSLMDPSQDDMALNASTSQVSVIKTTCRVYHNGPLCSVCESGTSNCLLFETNWL